MDNKTPDKKLVQGVAMLSIGSMLTGVVAYKVGGVIIRTIKMAITGKLD